MLPFSKRPPPPEEYFLRSGDFEAVNAVHTSSAHPHAHANPHARSGAYGAIPPAPRAPVFARQAQHTPYSFVQQPQHNAYNAYNHYGDLSVPPPPHSLAPVAMSAAERGAERGLASTGTNRTQGTILIREKPSLKWGVMIALSGALLGGVLGLGMDARRQSARAAAAAEAHDVAPPAMVATALPQAPAPFGAPAPLNAPNAVVASSLAAAPKPAPAAAAPAAAPVLMAPSAGVVVTPAKAEPRVARHQAPAVRQVSAPVRPTVSVAAKVSQPKAEPAPKAEAPVKAEPAPKAEKVAAEKATKKDSSTKAAQDLLEQANKDTVNTL